MRSLRSSFSGGWAAGCLAIALFNPSALFARPLDLGVPTARTPYDPYLRTVRRELRRRATGEPSWAEVQALLRQGRAFEYRFVTPYKATSPRRTEALRAGDCKDKALWLYSHLGASNRRFVVGKLKRSAPLSHAWVLWQHAGRWYVLDCTYHTEPLPVAKLGAEEYLPLYSWSASGAHAHHLPPTAPRP